MPDTPDPSFDPDSATIPLSGPRPTLSGSNVDLPLPEELAKLLPAGAYEVTDFLGAGGMGAVYKGMQVRLKRPVAIKIMRRDMGKDHDFEARFEREAQAMAKLNHPNIISVIDFGEAGPDYLFIVMELVDGTDLMDVIRSKQMTQEMALTLLPQICDALQFAHDHGIVHRDIKPSNIMLTRDGRVKMADFGLAKHFDHAESGFRTQTGTGMGTPDYAAPEQFDPTTQIDHRADIYALGVMIYQMITGALPRGVWRPPSQRAPVSTQWDAVVSRAMQNDPSERYQKASEVKTELSSIPLSKEGSTGTPARDQTQPPQSGANPNTDKNVRATPKSRTPLLLGIAASAIVIAAVAFFALRKPDEGRAAAPSAAATGPAATNSPDNAALAGASALPKAETLPESGWKPLIPSSEWRVDWSGETEYRGAKQKSSREYRDGLLHIRNTGIHNPQPSPDGAIRASIVIREGSTNIGVVMRNSATHGLYKLGIAGSSNGSILLTHNAPKTGDSIVLARHDLAKPLHTGDKVLLELKVQGDRLTGSLNGAVVVKASDSRLTESGEWSLDATDGWFESVEVQPLPAATAESWQDVLRDPKKLSLAPLVAWTPEGLRFTGIAGASLGTGQGPQRDAAVRMRTAFGAVRPRLTARQNKAGDKYMLSAADAARVTLYCWDETAKKATLKGEFSLRVPLQLGQDYDLELRVVGQTFTAKCNGETLGTVNDGTIAEGAFGVLVGDASGTPVLVKSLEVLDLDKPVSPSPNLPVSKSSDPKFPPGQWVKLFTKAEDLPEELRKSDSGVKWENGWISADQGKGLFASNGRLWTNAGIRFRTRITDHKHTVAAIRDANPADQNAADKLTHHYHLRADTASRAWILDYFREARPKAITEPIGQWPFQPDEFSEGKELQLEVFAVKDKIMARVDSRLLGVVTDSRIASGRLAPFILSPVRDIEVINLDGLTEAEALRLLGVDEKGNDLRGKTNADTQITSPSTLNLTPGKWERLNGRLKTEHVASFGASVTPDGVLKMGGMAVRLPIGKPCDIAVRARVKRPAGTDYTGISLRVDGIAHREIWLGNKGGVRLRATVDNKDIMSGAEHKIAPDAGEAKPVMLEVAVTGSRTYGTVDGTPVSMLDVQEPKGRGDVMLFCGSDKGEFSDIEVMVLDDVSEDKYPSFVQTALANWRAGKNTAVVANSASASAPLGGVPPAAEPWQDLLSDPGKLTLTGTVTRTAKGLTFAGGGWAMQPSDASVPRDGAVRTRSVFGQRRVALRARGKDKETAYVAYPASDGKTVTLVVANGREQWQPLRQFPLPKVLPSGQEYELELRVVGAEITVKFDGGIIGTVTDRTFTEGGFGAQSTDPAGSPVEIRTLEVLDLTASSPATATKGAPFVNTLGMKFIPVPITGGPTDKQRVLFSVWETRVQDYEVFAKETKREWPKADFAQTPTHPAVNVSWDDATAFCAWLTQRERKAGKIAANESYRLPSDHEWSCAAGLGGREDASKTPTEKDAVIADVFPWGDAWPPPAQAGNYWSEEIRAPGAQVKVPGEARDVLAGRNDGHAATAPVESFPSYRFGLHDLGGNVQEWCDDWMDAERKYRALRGGGWNNPAREQLLASNRTRGLQTIRIGDVGFRCVLAPTTSAAASVSPSPNLPVSGASSVSAAPLEPGAIRLWDAPEKLTSTPKGISWKDDALLIHSSVMAVRVDNKTLTHHDSIIRFSLRMNRDAQWANLIVRDAGTPAAPRQYKLSINPPTGVIKFIVADGGTERDLKSWPLPRPYASEEWLRVELRSLGDDFTVFVDGQPLETVHDTTLPNRGLTHFGASANAYFRDIVYVPLDAPAVPPSPSLPVSSSPSSATKAAPFTNTLGMKFVPVPITGGPTDGKRVLFSVWETRVHDYEVFVKETKREWKKSGIEQGTTHPAVNMNCEDAMAFCEWLTETERKAGKLDAQFAYRLPSDHEWSCAVGIGDKEDAAKTPEEKNGQIPVFPWGNQWPPPVDAGNYGGMELKPLIDSGRLTGGRTDLEEWQDSYIETAPCGSFRASRDGLFDLGGNAFEWCNTPWSAHSAGAVIRGGSTHDGQRERLFSSLRVEKSLNTTSVNLGFRCVLAPVTPIP